MPFQKDIKMLVEIQKVNSKISVNIYYQYKLIINV